MQPTTSPTPDPLSNPNLPNSAADDAALKAIEALESESSPVELPTEPAEVSAPPAATPIVDVAPPTPAIPTPVTPTTPAPQTPVIPAESIQPTAPPAPVESSTVQSSVARELNEGEPTPTTTFQPFVKKKRSKAPLIILVIVLLGLLGAGGYFGWQYLQSQQTKPATQTQTTEEPPVEQDSLESVNATVNDMQAQLDALDDANYADSTLSDTALYE